MNDYRQNAKPIEERLVAIEQRLAAIESKLVAGGTPRVDRLLAALEFALHSHDNRALEQVSDLLATLSRR